MPLLIHDPLRGRCAEELGPTAPHTVLTQAPFEIDGYSRVELTGLGLNYVHRPAALARHQGAREAWRPKSQPIMKKS